MTPPIVARCQPLLERYDVLFCDVWGVVHDGNKAFPASNDALARFRARGGIVILLTNAPQPEARVAEILVEKSVVSEAWDAIVTSGDIALGNVRSRGFKAVHHIGPAWRSRPLLAKLPGHVDNVANADAIVCSGLVDDHGETAEDYRSLLEVALDRKLTFICANPDLWVHVGDKLLPCAGVIATLYAEMGGEVVWAGKPHKPVYDAAFAKAAELRGAAIDRRSVLAVGDALRTDLSGAAQAGIDALFIASGIHRDEVMAGGAIVPVNLAKLFAANPIPAIGAAIALNW